MIVKLRETSRSGHWRGHRKFPSEREEKSAGLDGGKLLHSQAENRHRQAETAEVDIYSIIASAMCRLSDLSTLGSQMCKRDFFQAGPEILGVRTIAVNAVKSMSNRNATPIPRNLAHPLHKGFFVANLRRSDSERIPQDGGKTGKTFQG